MPMMPMHAESQAEGGCPIHRAFAMSGIFERSSNRFCRPLALALTLIALVLAALPARAASPELEKVLRQMDAASAQFKSAQADFRWEQYTMVVQSTDVQSGTVYFRRNGKSTQMAAQIRQLNGRNDPKTLVYDGQQLQLFQPKINQITYFSPGSNKDQYESFLTLGFGGSGKDLQANWDITFAGYETLKDGAQSIQTAHLELVSKTASVRNMFSRISIWVDPTHGVSLKQVFTEPTGDSRTAYYFAIRVNSSIDSGAFTIKAPSNVTKVRR
ncbi:MAG: outer membrane lipoprotein-sorting protein [Acidobacteriaceae bacterium]|nr:outer membrane lipoprotein-sorting protein [Acidobacteriaceae bacterium]